MHDEGSILAVGRDVESEVPLVGRLVFTETRVAVESVGAIFHREVGHRGVDDGKAANQLLGHGFENEACAVVLVAVGGEPSAVVVRSNVAQELIYDVDVCHNEGKVTKKHAIGQAKRCISWQICEARRRKSQEKNKVPPTKDDTF